MRAWQFRQKTPGFGLSKHYYMTVLSGSSVLPSMRQIINPKGDGGAVEGFGVPLASTATKDDLDRPLQRGSYAISTKDRRTILKMIVVSKEEAGFDPGPFLRSPLAQTLSPELVSRVSATWTLLQLTFESHDPMVYPALKFVLQFCSRVASLSDGVVADPISETYKLPEEVFAQPQVDELVDARDHVNIVVRQKPEGLAAHTLGLQKFALPELEIFGLDAAERMAAGSILMSLAQSSLRGEFLSPGDKVGSRDIPLQVAPGGLDRGTWEGIECHELIPPTGKTTSEALIAWIADLNRG